MVKKQSIHFYCLHNLKKIETFKRSQKLVASINFDICKNSSVSFFSPHLKIDILINFFYCSFEFPFFSFNLLISLIIIYCLFFFSYIFWGIFLIANYLFVRVQNFHFNSIIFGFLFFFYSFPLTRTKCICFLLALAVVGTATYFIVRQHQDINDSNKGSKGAGAVVANGEECAAIGM